MQSFVVAHPYGSELIYLYTLNSLLEWMTYSRKAAELIPNLSLYQPVFSYLNSWVNRSVIADHRDARTLISLHTRDYHLPIGLQKIKGSHAWPKIEFALPPLSCTATVYPINHLPQKRRSTSYILKPGEDFHYELHPIPQ